MRRALADPLLLGGALAGTTWRVWRVLLIAAMGEALTDEERKLFTDVTGREREPLQCVEELVVVAGRRGGKSRALATLACYLATLCDHSASLVSGEQAVVLCLGPDQRQANVVHGYAVSMLESSRMLSGLIEGQTADTLTLGNGITLETRAASFRRLRGLTLCAAILDECAFFQSEEASSNPDTEIANALRPALSTTNGLLCLASSPYAKKGLLFETYRQHFGADGDPLVLVAKGTSQAFNPSLSERVVARALERDHAAASAEYLAEFRNDISGFVSAEVVQACVGAFYELPPANWSYAAFVDPSGGSSDSFTMGIGHVEGEQLIVDLLREYRPPFSPAAVVEEMVKTLRRYRVPTVVGDKYAGEFPRELFRKAGIEYRCADLPKSDLYRDLLPLLNSGKVTLPKNPRAVSQICGLERRVSRAGRDSIDSGPGGHDDIANCIAGVASVLTNAPPALNFTPKQIAHARLVPAYRRHKYRPRLLTPLGVRRPVTFV